MSYEDALGISLVLRNILGMTADAASCLKTDRVVLRRARLHFIKLTAKAKFKKPGSRPFHSNKMILELAGVRDVLNGTSNSTAQASLPYNSTMPCLRLTV